MAIAHVNTGSDNESSFTSSFVFDYGFSPVEGNILVVMIGSNNVGSISDDGNWNQLYDAGTNGHHGWCGWKVAGASEPSSATWTRGISQKWVGGIVELSGQHGTPVDVSGQNNGSSATPTSPDVTTGVDGCYIVAGFVSDIDDATAAAESGLGNKWTDTSTSGSGQCTAGGSESQASAGATGTYVHSATSAQWRAYTVAIAPAAGAASPDINYAYVLRIT